MSSRCPPSIASAMSKTQPWPIEQSRPPMHYKPLVELADIRAAAQLTPHADDLPLSPVDLLSLVADDPFAVVAIALLYLSYGCPEECHALVTPIAWHDHDDSSFAFQSNCGKTPSVAAEAAATYAHLLLHRWEGSNVGERGSSGYMNANFLGKATLARGEGSLPFHKIRQRIRSVLLFGGNAPTSLSAEAVQAGQEWFEEWIVEDLPDELDWEPRALTELCKQIENKFVSDDRQLEALAEFCGVACQVECHVLMEYCWESAGYSLSSEEGMSGTVSPDDDDEDTLSRNESASTLEPEASAEVAVRSTKESGVDDEPSGGNG